MFFQKIHVTDFLAHPNKIDIFMLDILLNIYYNK